LTRDLENQEKAYKSTHEDLVRICTNFNKEVEEFYRVSFCVVWCVELWPAQEVELMEIERVNTLKECMQQFTK